MSEEEILHSYYKKIFSCNSEEQDGEGFADLMLALLNEEEDDIIESTIAPIPECVDIFLINSFPKTQLAYDNVYVFSSKHFLEISPKQIQYDIIQDNSLHAAYAINRVIRNWQRVKEGGLLILSNTNGDMKKNLEHYFAPLDIEVYAWHEDENVLIFKKQI
ncbi:hypothetical protein CL634_07365 [bacterium]|nr:hypothetical protein [bacterium]